MTGGGAAAGHGVSHEETDAGDSISSCVTSNSACWYPCRDWTELVVLSGV